MVAIGRTQPPGVHGVTNSPVTSGPEAAGAVPAEVSVAPVPSLYTSPAIALSVGRGAGQRVELGAINGKKLEFGTSGRLLLGGQLGSSSPGVGADAELIYRTAELLAAKDGDFFGQSLTQKMRGRIFAQLDQALTSAQLGNRTRAKEKALSGSLALLTHLAQTTPASSAALRAEIVDRVLAAVAREPNIEIAAFYLQTTNRFLPLNSAQKKVFEGIEARLLPPRPLIEEYTENRTKPLEIRHSVHEEFWKEELALFSKKNGWKLVSKDSKDTKRTYKGVLKDPTGKKPPLNVNLVVVKGELDTLEHMNDPKVHVIMYSGHSSLGGNGSQAVEASPTMKGKHPKLYFAANCRGGDNYPEFTNKHTRAHVIMTEKHTYSVSGQARIEAMFDTFARGESYAYMRKKTEKKHWDEPANNYFYPDEWRKFGFMDSDQDGKVDFHPARTDRLYDVGLGDTGLNFMRAINFARSELYYHWEVEHSNGKKSYFGKRYADSLLAGGPIPDPKPGELVRVSPVKTKPHQPHLFRVEYNASLAKKIEPNVLGGLVTFHIGLAMADHKNGETNALNSLRAAVMGAQACHYLDVYSDTSPVTYQRYFEKIGLTNKMKEKDIEDLFKKFDSHANTAQTKAFQKLLETQYGVDVAAWHALQKSPLV